MRNLILAGAAALTFATVPTYAQTAVLTTEQQTMYDGWTAENRATYDAWPDAAKTYYWTLTPAQMEGWWALNDEQRVQIVGMTPEQRATTWTSIESQLAARENGAAATTADATMTSGAAATTADTTMTADAAAPADAAMAADTSSATADTRIATGADVTAATTATGATADTAATVMSTSSPAPVGNMQFVKREMTQPVQASADAAALASGDLPVCKADQQDGCINSYEKTGKGTRPLNYWPGKPASEIAGSKPQG